MSAPQDGYPDWDNYPVHAEALVWRHPVHVGADRTLRHVVGYALSNIAGLAPPADGAFESGYTTGERQAYLRTLAYLSGLTESRWRR